MNSPINNKNYQGQVECAKSAPHIIVSAGVCFEENGQLHFIKERAKINTHCYINDLLPNLVEDYRDMFGNNFVFQKMACMYMWTR